MRPCLDPEGGLRRPGRGLLKKLQQTTEKGNTTLKASNPNLKSNRATPGSVTFTGISGHVRRNTH
ncbi:hypothetical protein THIX_50115 [Thiomonas sp. X19]|nr:hypothetical protein THIX_50115 [Thiomonas sp. X19]